MRQNTQELRRGRGRPQIRSDEETLRLIIEAARQEFPAKGYAGASMGTVAQMAGVSTKTLYRLVPTKADLFRMIVSDRIGSFMLAIDEEVLGGLDLVAALERILIAFGSLTLNEEVIGINRLVLGEGDRFPEIASTFYQGAMLRTSYAISGWLERQCAHGLITLEDPVLAAEMLRGMMIMDPQRAAMLGQRPVPGPEEIAWRARNCAEVFLKGCLKTPVAAGTPLSRRLEKGGAL